MNSIKRKNKYLIAVSGGPDSFFLLHNFKHKNIIVAHINYQKRKQGTKEQEYVESFCKDNNIPFFQYVVQKQDYGIHSKNFQEDARILRYLFFQKIYQQNDCSALLVAHHKDDFIESVLMQKSKNKTVVNWGMKYKTKNFNMTIIRPFINLYWKSQIVKYLKINKHKYFIDESNHSNDYQRNIIRNKLSYYSVFKKEKIFQKAIIQNSWLFKKNDEIEKIKVKWIKSKYDKEFFKSLTNFTQNQILHFWIYSNFNSNKINLSYKKIDLLKKFILGENRTSNFILKKDVNLVKIKSIYYKKDNCHLIELS